MEQAVSIQTQALYARHARTADRTSWSLVSDVRWGDIDTVRAREQQDMLLSVRWLALELSARGARTARTLTAMAADPHASAALTLELWDGLKHFHALRTYLDTVEFAPRLSDEELKAVREAELQAEDAAASHTERLLRILLVQHLAIGACRRLGSRSDEPVLAELLSLIASDEGRHAEITSDLLRLRLSSGGMNTADIREAARRVARQGGGAPAGHGAVDDVAVQAFSRRVEMLCGASE